MTNNLRPDELATQSEIKKSMGRTSDIRSGLEAISSFGGVTLGAQAASKVLPFINQYIPKDLALKGINKVMPSLGKFLQNGVSQGLSLQSGLDFLKDEFSKESSKKENPKEQRNIIEQYSPELHSFLKEHIQNGRSPLEAGALAQLDTKFTSAIKKLSEDHKTNFSSILQSVFGNGQQNSPQSPQQAQQTQAQPSQAGQQQVGQGQQQLVSILQKINQKLGG